MFPLCTSAPVTPKSLGFDVWLRPAAVTLTGGKVDTQLDQSGNANDGTQSNAALRTTPNAAGINGRPSLTYVRATGMYIEGATSIGVTGSRKTMIAVVKMTAGAGGTLLVYRKTAGVLATGMSNALADAGYYITYNSSANYQEFGAGQSVPDPTGVPAIVEVTEDRVSDDRRAKFLFQGVPYELGAGASSIGTDDGGAGWTFGARIDGGLNMLGSLGAEAGDVTVKGGSVNWGDKLRIYARFAAEYGLTVDGRTRVMHFGDSLTAGVGDAGTVAAGGIRVAFATDVPSTIGVGSIFGPTALPLVYKHCGLSGFTTAQLDAVVTDRYSDDPAQLVCYNGGTNDFFHAITAAQTAANIVASIAKFKAINPKVRIVISLVINVPTSEAAENAFVVTQNAAITAAVAGIPSVTAFQPRTLADDKFQSDKLHLNAAGYAQWEQDWVAAVQAVGYR